MQKRAFARNALLSALPIEEQELLANDLERVPLALMEELAGAGEAPSHVWFPQSGVVSVVADLMEGDAVEVATIGREGFVGLPVALHSDSMKHRTFVQVPGEAERMSAAKFVSVLSNAPTLNRLVLRYAMALVTLISQTSACSRMHPIETRCALWLLLTRDRVDSDSFPLRQEFLAMMLGVTRPSVSVAAGMLHKAGGISYSRGIITITDRALLEASSCECYEIIKSEFARLIGSPGGGLGFGR
jgi:CRP-like cAMP-binding protein